MKKVRHEERQGYRRRAPLSNLSLLNVELNEIKNIYHKTYDL